MQPATSAQAGPILAYLIGEEVPFSISEVDNLLPLEVGLHKLSGMCTEELTLRECFTDASEERGESARDVRVMCGGEGVTV